MAEQQSMLKTYKTFAASAAVLMLVAWLTVPAIASHEVAPGLTDKNEALVKLERESESPTPFLTPKVLAPRAEAAIREAFKAVYGVSAANNLSESGMAESAEAAPVPPLAKAKSSADASSVDHRRAETPLGMNTRLPGVSEKDLLLYKKQMYRKDI